MQDGREDLTARNMGNMSLALCNGSHHLSLREVYSPSKRDRAHRGAQSWSDRP